MSNSSAGATRGTSSTASLDFFIFLFFFKESSVAGSGSDGLGFLVSCVVFYAILQLC